LRPLPLILSSFVAVSSSKGLYEGPLCRISSSSACIGSSLSGNPAMELPIYSRLIAIPCRLVSIVSTRDTLKTLILSGARLPCALHERSWCFRNFVFLTVTSHSAAFRSALQDWLRRAWRGSICRCSGPTCCIVFAFLQHFFPPPSEAPPSYSAFFYRCTSLCQQRSPTPDHFSRRYPLSPSPRLFSPPSPPKRSSPHFCVVGHSNPRPTIRVPLSSLSIGQRSSGVLQPIPFTVSFCRSRDI